MPARARSTPLRVKGKWPPVPRKAASDSPRRKSSSSPRVATPSTPSTSSRSRRAVMKRTSPGQLPSGTMAVSPLGLFAKVSARRASTKASGARRASTKASGARRASSKASGARRASSKASKKSSSQRRPAKKAAAPKRRLRARASLRVEQAGPREMVQRYRMVRVLPGGAVVGQEVRIRVVKKSPRARRARSFSPVKPLRILN